MTQHKSADEKAKRRRMTSAARRLFEEAGIFCRAHDYPRALRATRQALLHAPDNVGLLREEAWYLNRLGYKASALRVHKRVSRLLPRWDGWADLEACGLALALGREDEARRLLARALKRSPKLIGDAQEDEQITRLLKRFDKRRPHKGEEITKNASRRGPRSRGR